MAESNANTLENNATVSATLFLGAQFESLNVLCSKVREQAIKSHVELRHAKHDRSRYTVVCKAEGCMWRLHASLVSSGPRCMVKAFHDEHTCGGASQLGNKEATAEWVAARYVEKLRDHPMYRLKERMANLRREVGVSISYKNAWKAKQLALGIIHGDHAKSYGKLRSYCDKLVASNPGTMAHLQKTTEDIFINRQTATLRARMPKEGGFLAQKGRFPLLGYTTCFFPCRYPYFIVNRYLLIYAIVGVSVNCSSHGRTKVKIVEVFWLYQNFFCQN
ncbi:hypothetical protein GOP47_0022574 [Adiantum capillus-veneris]|uniref:Transposase MuDR plant domain-containing protein n=1 Tax=Adiantum capillus-veneris TaxID=13818 RepID=A0A9D4Z5M8_ADICA|nr:hypothetical protein GOP47_0022574 [Adiantum capillus-veneris]